MGGYNSLSAAMGQPPGGGDPQEELKRRVKEFYDERWPRLKSSFVTFHMLVWEALLFYVGEFWIKWSRDRKIYEPDTPNDEFTPQPKINRFSPAVDAISSNFGTIPEIEANASDLDDLRAHGVAKVASALAKDWVTKQALRAGFKTKDALAQRASQLFVLSGGFFTDVYPEKRQVGERPAQQPGGATKFGVMCPACDTYKIMDQPAAACPMCQGPVENIPTATTMGQDVGGAPVMEPVFQYEICGDILTLLEGFPRPGARSMFDSPFFFSAKRMPIDDIKARYDYDAQADQEFPDGFSSTYENALNFYYVGSTSVAQATDSALVVKVYVEATNEHKGVKDLPEGCVATIINGQVVECAAWDLAEHPITKVDYLCNPTIFHPRSVAFDLVPLQRELGAYESIIKLHAMTSAVDTIVIDANTMITQPTGRADKVLKWRSISPNSKEPHRMPHGSLDEGIYKKIEQLHQEFDNISMAVAVFRGQQEGGVTAASAIQQLRGQAEQMFSRPVLGWNNGWKETIRKAVSYMQKHYDPAQIAAIVGQDKAVQISDFKQVDLDATLEWAATTHGLPRTRDERRQEMMMLFDHGALDINDPKVKEKLFELFGETGMFSSFNADATRARFENKQMIGAAKPPLFMPELEDLAVHYGIHNDAIKSLEFEGYPPQVKNVLMQHTLMTRAALMSLPPPAPPGQATAADGSDTTGSEPAAPAGGTP